MLVDGIVLRYGAFYGPSTSLFDDTFLEEINRRCLPVVGNGDSGHGFASGCRPSQPCSLRCHRGTCRLGWRALPPANTSSS